MPHRNFSHRFFMLDNSSLVACLTICIRNTTATKYSKKKHHSLLCREGQHGYYPTSTLASDGRASSPKAKCIPQCNSSFQFLLWLSHIPVLYSNFTGPCTQISTNPGEQKQQNKATVIFKSSLVPQLTYSSEDEGLPTEAQLC